jgi:hypothetical protein
MPYKHRNPLQLYGNHLQVLLDSFDVAFDHAVRCQVKKGVVQILLIPSSSIR